MAAPPNILRFVVHDPASLGAAAEDAAHVLGPDDVPIRGDVKIARGKSPIQLRCGFADEESAALALPVRAGRAGELMLQTCLLPPREMPYGLLVELARYRIKQFIQKCEEWQMWEPGLARGAMRIWDEARAIFAEALLASSELDSERLACRSLEKSIEASEHLAMSHAEILLHRRYGTRAAGSVVLGAVIRPSTPPSTAVEEAIAKETDVVAIPLRWRDIEPVRGKPDFKAADRWMQWAADRKKPVMAGPLIELRESALPDYAKVFRHDYESFRDVAYDHVERLAARYGGVVGIWNVGAGFHANEFLELTPEQMVDLARRVVFNVRQRNRKANTLVELVDPFSQSAMRRRGAIAPWRYLELLQQEGIPISAAGIRLALGRDGATARDLFQVSGMLDRFLGRETRFLLSSFGVPCEEVDPTSGHWREGWSLKSQASWAGRVASVAMSKPFIETLFWAEASDAAGPESRGYGLFDASGKARPVLAKLASWRRRLRTPLGPRSDDPCDDSFMGASQGAAEGGS